MNERRIRNAEDEFQNKNLDTNDEIDKAFKKIYLDAIEKFETERKNMHETEHTEMNKKIEEILKTVKDLITVNEKSSNKTLNSINKLLEEINSKGKEAKNSIESFK
jgi:endo-alpha-1,4-polygalactosaminidase (GH114 family)